MGGAKALREAPGRATDVAKTRSERSGKRRDGAKRKVSEGSSLRLALVAAACRSSLRWLVVAGLGWRLIRVLWQLFKIVLGFTPRRRPCKAGPSQNDDFLPRFGIYPLYTALQGTSIPKRFGTTLFRLLCSNPKRCSASQSDLHHELQ